MDNLKNRKFKNQEEEDDFYSYRNQPGMSDDDAWGIINEDRGVDDGFWDILTQRSPMLAKTGVKTPSITPPVLSDQSASPEDTEHAFNLGGWLKETGSTVLGGVENGLSGMGDWMQKNPELIAGMAGALGRYAWDPDVGRDQFGTYSTKRAIWDSMNTGVNTHSSFEKQTLADKQKKRGALEYKDGGFYNIKKTDGPDGPGYSINPLMRTKQQEPGFYEKKIFEEGLVRGRPSKENQVQTGKIEYQSSGDGKEQGFMFNQHGKNQWSEWGKPRNRKGEGGSSGPLSSAGKIYSDMQKAREAGDADKVAFLQKKMWDKVNSNKDVFGAEKDLRKEFVAGSKDFVAIRDAYTRIMAVGQDPSGFGDLALIFNYMKMLDPGSVVRESEFATAQNTGSIGQRFIAMFNRAKLGMRLSAPQRKELMQSTMGLWGTKKQAHDVLINENLRLANSAKERLFPNLDAESTVIRYEEPSPEEVNKTAKYYKQSLSGSNVSVGRDQYEKHGYVKALHKIKGRAEEHPGAIEKVTEGTYEGIYVSELNPGDNTYYWVQHK